MPSPSRDIKTSAIVLRRVNYGETDRILTFLTPTGKISALAKGVRKERSKLAGGIELFTLSEIMIHEGQNGGLGILTSSKMTKFYSHIMEDMPRLELASRAMKLINQAAEGAPSPEFFSILRQVFAALDHGADLQLIELWFNLNLKNASGDELNLTRDVFGNPLSEQHAYTWDSRESALRLDVGGSIRAPEIKAARLIVSSSLRDVCRITNVKSYIPKLLPLAN